MLALVQGKARERKFWLELATVLRDVVGDPLRPVTADLAFDRLPILADALQNAGCVNPDLLGHLRGPGPHVRGCWAIDLILGRG